jgi:hypothetical protein
MRWQLPRTSRSWAPNHPMILAIAATVGLLAHEVAPRYEIERSPHRLLDFPTFLMGDCPYYRATLVSVLEDGDLDLHNNLAIDQLSPSDNVALGKDGAWYPKHPVLMSLAALPFYAVAGDDGLLAFNLAQIVGLLLVVWLAARRYASDDIALAVALWYAFGTLLRPFSYNFAPDVFSTLLVASGIVALLYKRPLLAGALLGLACGAKWTNVGFLLPAFVFLVARRPWTNLVRFAAAVSVPIGALLLLNFHMFGSPFDTPYDRVLVLQGGHMVLAPSARTFFSLPFWDGLWAQIANRRLGLIVSAPPVLLALPGLVVLARRCLLEALLIGGACAVQLATFAKYEQWSVTRYGHRFLMTVVVLSALPVAALIDQVLRSPSSAASTERVRSGH